jgi:hypothetical protein
LSDYVSWKSVFLKLGGFLSKNKENALFPEFVNLSLKKMGATFVVPILVLGANGK